MTQTPVVFPNQWPFAPDTFAVLQGVATLLTTYIQPLQINGADALKTVVVGGIKDFAEMVPVVGISLKQLPMKRKATGGRMEHEIILTLSTFQDYTDEQIAESYIAQMVDLQAQLFASHVRLAQLAPGIVKSSLSENDPVQFGFNTTDYPIPIRAFDLTLHVIQQWNNANFQQN